MPLTDSQLLIKIKEEFGHVPPLTGAFEELLERYQKLIYYISRRYFSSNEDAMDASQEAALKIYNGLQKVTIAEDGSLKAWICTVVARTCLDSIRKQRIKTTELMDETIKSTLPSAEDTVTAKERVNEILNAIQNLPKDHRMVLILRDMQGLSYDKIAHILGVNIGTVKSRLSRARDSLKKELDYAS